MAFELKHLYDDIIYYSLNALFHFRNDISLHTNPVGVCVCVFFYVRFLARKLFDIFTMCVLPFQLFFILFTRDFFRLNCCLESFCFYCGFGYCCCCFFFLSYFWIKCFKPHKPNEIGKKHIK